MDVRKEAAAAPGGTPTEEQLAAINALAKTAMTAEQVYVFSLRLCDDQPDRDFERFDTQSLPGLARLFVGKTGIVDHRWSADTQVARIFSTEVVTHDGVSYIKAWAYMPRTPERLSLIGDIEAGIKKEISVGCAMGKRVCSICSDSSGECGHLPGAEYNGQVCCYILQEPVDAYEFSFVAVPSQREAGVLKQIRHRQCLKELAAEFGAQAEYRTLEMQAALGRKYAGQLQDEVVRLCLALELGIAEPALREMVQKADAGSLRLLKTALEARLSQKMPVKSQLLTADGGKQPLEAGFMI